MKPFHMVQIDLDAAKMHLWAASCRLPPGDTGYLCHALMCDAYGDLRPRPFAVVERPGSLKILGYAAHAAEALAEMRRETAEPSVVACFRSEQSKEMPTAWVAGRRYGFELRACPTRQGHDPGKAESGRKRAKREADAMLFATGDRERSDVYREWLLERVGDAATVDRLEMTAFRLFRASRRRESARCDGRRVMDGVVLPDALFRGVLSVRDPGAFAALVSGGIGRHKAFGFGALLLRPAGS